MLDQLALASIDEQNFILRSPLNHTFVLLGITVVFPGSTARSLARAG